MVVPAAVKTVAGKLSRRLQVRVLSGAPAIQATVLLLANNCMVSVAQLVEPRIVIPAVVGSSPIVHPIVVSLEKFRELHLVLGRFVTSESGGIGRRAGFRIQWGNP